MNSQPQSSRRSPSAAASLAPPIASIVAAAALMFSPSARAQQQTPPSDPNAPQTTTNVTKESSTSITKLPDGSTLLEATATAHGGSKAAALPRARNPHPVKHHAPSTERKSVSSHHATGRSAPAAKAGEATAIAKASIILPPPPPPPSANPPAPPAVNAPADHSSRENDIKRPKDVPPANQQCGSSHTSFFGVSTASVPVTRTEQTLEADFRPKDGEDVPAEQLLTPNGMLSLSNPHGLVAANIHMNQDTQSDCVVFKGPSVFSEVTLGAGETLTGGGALAYGIGGLTGAEATRINDQTSVNQNGGTVTQNANPHINQTANPTVDAPVSVKVNQQQQQQQQQQQKLKDENTNIVKEKNVTVQPPSGGDDHNHDRDHNGGGMGSGWGSGGDKGGDHGDKGKHGKDGDHGDKGGGDHGDGGDASLRRPSFQLGIIRNGTLTVVLGLTPS